eukprot:TRINITY_DN3368_c0_g1_i1.p1 TRINITY_DN3368_c0_g1~~TRINITY_DN3368_c0_g1_i1.p1  ORF type:complete len:449 (-),score=99.03 TRINITY_DN3368_c0_g1_i1:41-1282(-)
MSSKEPEEKQPASAVAHVFVEKYYTILEQKIQLLYKFYHQDASCTRRDRETQTFIGSENIREALIAHETAGGRVSLSSVDYQTSVGEAVVISVIGSIWKNKSSSTENVDDSENTERRFVQTFLLIPDPDRLNLYYVMNDVFAFLEDEEIVQDQDEEIEDAETESKIHSRSTRSENEPIETEEPSTIPEELNQQDSEIHKSPTPVQEKEVQTQPSSTKPKPKKGKSANPKSSVAPAPSVAKSKPKSAPTAPPPTAAAKKSWSDLVTSKISEGPDSTPAPSATSAAPPTKPVAKAPEKQSPKTALKSEVVEVTIENIPPRATWEEVLELLHQYGSGEIKILNLYSGKCYIECDNQMCDAITDPPEPIYMGRKELNIYRSPRTRPQGGNQNRPKNPSRPRNDYPRGNNRYQNYQNR